MLMRFYTWKGMVAEAAIVFSCLLLFDVKSVAGYSFILLFVGSPIGVIFATFMVIFAAPLGTTL